MKHFRGIWLNVAVAFLMCGAALAAIPQISGFATQQDGNTVNAALWNSAIGGVYTYINQNVVPAINTLTNKGDLLTSDASTNLNRFPVGTDGNVLVADSTQTLGLRWGNIANVSNLTTKGDLLTSNGSINQRLGVGTDGFALVSRSTAPFGIAWENTSAPSGLIALWSGTVSNIPSGWHLCDGTSGTPNLQGLYVVGAGSTSPAATGGMGLLTPGGPSGNNSAGAGLGPSHAHTVSYFVSSVGSGGSNVGVSLTSSGTTSSQTVTPRYYALCYIMKQ